MGKKLRGNYKLQQVYILYVFLYVGVMPKNAFELNYLLINQGSNVSEYGDSSLYVDL